MNGVSFFSLFVSRRTILIELIESHVFPLINNAIGRKRICNADSIHCRIRLVRY